MHKKTREALWLENSQNSPCVAIEIATMTLSIVQLHIFPWSKNLTKYVKDGQPKKVI